MITGQIIKQQRLRLGLTQTELAEKAGISINHVSNIESGKRKGTMEMINKILKVFKAKSIEELMLIELTAKACNALDKSALDNSETEALNSKKQKL